MNFIKMDTRFINLREVESIDVDTNDNGIEVTIHYRSGRQESNWMDFPPNVITNLDDVREAIAEGLKDAILSCADADCEDIADYVDIYDEDYD